MPMHRFIFNGKLVDATEKIVGPGSRALRYGDGLFETIKWHNGEGILIKEHYHRLFEGAKALQLEIPKNLTTDKISEEINKLLSANNITGTARVRLMLMRQDGGLYDCTSNIADYVIEAWPIKSHTQVNNNGLQLEIYKDAIKSADKFSRYKHNNFLPYLMAALSAQKNKNNDAIVCNAAGSICDTTIANIFFVKNREIFTPPIEEGCVEGVMRNFVMQALSALGFSVKEKTILPGDIKDYQEVFLTNSIYNLRWVAGIEDAKYTNSFIFEINEMLQKKFPEIFI